MIEIEIENLDKDQDIDKLVKAIEKARIEKFLEQLAEELEEVDE